jgi:hypothetical protein
VVVAVAVPVDSISSNSSSKGGRKGESVAFEVVMVVVVM